MDTGTGPDLVVGAHFDMLRNNFLARAQMQLLAVLLNKWRAGGIGAAMRAAPPS